MQISCEKCSTTYALDDRLIPPGGAPVQCTRCGHVFLAVLPSEQRRSGTQIFGAPKPEPKTELKTQVFGSPPAAPQPEPPRPATQMFGAVPMPGAPAPEPKPEQKTQVFGAGQLPKVTFGGGATVGSSAPPATEITAPMEFDLGDPKDIDPGMAATQQMEEHDVARALAALNAKAEAKAKAQQPRPASPPRAAAPAPVELPPEPPGAVEEALALAEEKPKEGGARAPAKVELPPEPPAFPSEPVTDFAETAGPPPGRWGRRVAIAAVALGALAGVFVGVRTVQERLHAIPPEAMVQRDTALVILRRDDPESMERALAQLQQALALAPGYVEAQADLVMVLALQADDAKVALALVAEQEAQLDAQMAALRELQSPSDWQNRVNVMSEEKAALVASEPALRTAARALVDRLEDEFQRLVLLEERQKSPPPQAVRASARAKAMYFAIRPEDRALAFIDQYRALGSDSWAELATAEYALGPRAPAELVARASEALEALRERDSSLVRAHVLYARLALRRGHPDGAADALNVALSLAPQHAAAKELLASAQAAMRASSAQQSPNGPPANADGTVQ